MRKTFLAGIFKIHDFVVLQSSVASFELRSEMMRVCNKQLEIEIKVRKILIENVSSWCKKGCTIGINSGVSTSSFPIFMSYNVSLEADNDPETFYPVSTRIVNGRLSMVDFLS